MSDRDYSIVARTPLTRIRELPTAQLIAFLESCTPLVRTAIYRTLLSR